MKKKLLCTLFASMIMLQSVPASAEETVVTEAGTANILITANVASVFEVRLPDVVEITERAVKEFEITATGNIGVTETLSIVLPESVSMSTVGKDPIALPLTSSASSLTSEQLAAEGGAVIECTVDASNISSGAWAGTCPVEIALVTPVEGESGE